MLTLSLPSRLRLTLLASALALLGACDDTVFGVPTETDPDMLFYTPDWDGVTAMSEDHCQSCHAPGGSASHLPLPEALAFDLDAGSGEYVVPLDPDASRLWRVIGGELADGDFGDMPLGARLPTNLVDHVRLWILDGAPYPAVVRDDDGDGVSVADGDCDDLDPTAYPGAPEVCDGVDNDCDGAIDVNPTDGTTYYADADGDGYGSIDDSVALCAPATGFLATGTDCDDTNPAVNPGALETDCRDDTDYNCDGVRLGVDADGDGSWACDDCDDTAADVFPGAPELCDGVDQDCDGTVDNDAVDATDWYPDLDQDGHGDASATPVTQCLAPGVGWVAVGDDCADGNGTVHPGAVEVCNGVDNDCDGTPDDGAVDQTNWYLDVDGDGFGDDGTAVLACANPGGRVSVGGDCDDGSTAYNPGASETDCSDPNDYNCDGVVGAVDGDGDGFFACEECDDTNAAVNPLATEVCDGADNDCSGEVDDGATDAQLWFPDADADTYGDDSATGVLSCSAPTPGWTTTAGDCDDTSPATHPGATEICDFADNDCDGPVDEGSLDSNQWYPDTDGDGEGAGTAVPSCDTAFAGHVLNADDCDDSDALVNSAAVEVCDGVDNDCSGLADDEAIDGTAFYDDSDGDGFGSLVDSGFLDCRVSVPGASTDNTDCNDANASVNPGAPEVCDGLDNDCSGAPDDNAVDADWSWLDSDGDGYGDEGDPGVLTCTVPPGNVLDNSDCDDSDGAVNPGVVYDFADSVDNDCDGSVDEDGTAPSHAVDIQPIWDAECLGACHAAPMPTGGMDLSGNAYGVIVGVPSGDVPTMNRIEPGSPALSYLWHKLNDTQASVGGTGNGMPAAQAGPPGSGGLSASEMALIEAWILAGALP